MPPRWQSTQRMLREPLGDSGEDQMRGGKRRVEEKPDQRHQPVLLHRLDAQRKRGMDVHHGAARRWRAPTIGQNRWSASAMPLTLLNSIAARESPARAHRALELGHRGRRIVERQRGQRGEARARACP